MAIASDFGTIPSNSTNALFRAWGSALAAKLLAAGLVQTSDTGQINWTTVSAPGAANTYQGYEIWRFDDTYQSVSPVYIKLEYGSGTAAANPSLRVQIGTSTNGSGALTGATMTQQAITASTSSTALNYQSFICASSSRIGLVMWAQLNNCALGLFIERTRNGDGTENAKGITQITMSNSGKNQQTMSFESGGVPTAQTTITCFNPEQAQGSGYTHSTGVAYVGAYPVIPYIGAAMLPQMIGLMAYFNFCLITGTTINTVVYRQNRTYVAMPNNSFITQFTRNQTANMQMLLLFDTL